MRHGPAAREPTRQGLGGGVRRGTAARRRLTSAMAALAAAAVILALAVAAAPLDAHAGSATAGPCDRSGSSNINSIEFRSPNGTYKIGDTIDIRASSAYDFGSDSGGFDTTESALHLLGHTHIRLETGGESEGYANFTEAPNSGHWAEWRYTVRAGDNTSDLDYDSTRAMYFVVTHGSTTTRIEDGNNNPMKCYLPQPRGPGSLSAQADIRLDGIAPRVANVTVSPPSGGYGLGDGIEFGVNFDDTVVYSGAAPILMLNLSSGETRNASYTGGNNTNRFTFAYEVQGGDDASDVGYNGTMALTTAGNMTDKPGNPANLTLSASGPLGRSGPVPIDATRPTVLNVTSPNGTGPHREGSIIAVRALFSENVDVDTAGGTPWIELSTGAAVARYAEYDAAASTGRTLEFSYSVTDGDDTADLDYAGTTALTENGAIIRDAVGNRATDLALPDPVMAGPFGALGPIRLDTTRPTVESVSSTTPNGTYGIDSRIVVTVTFSEDVVVDETGGTPRIELSTGAAVARYAEYDAAASTGRTLEFSYSVTDGDDTADLDYAGTTALTENGAIIRDAVGNRATDLALPQPGTDGLLDSGMITLDTVSPEVEYVYSETDDGLHPVGTTIDVRVKLSEIVVFSNASGTPSIRLETGATDRNATLAGGNNSDTLVFSYTVRQGDETDDLNYTGTAALSANGGTIRDAAGNDADLELPGWGFDDTLGERKDIAVDTVAPKVRLAEAESLDRIRVTFDGPVTSGSMNASAGWSISGPSAANLSIAALGPVNASAPKTEIVFAFNDTLPDTAPDLELSYDASEGGIRDEAGNQLQDRTGIAVADRIRPSIDEALITGNLEITIDYTEPVAASQGAYSGLEIGGTSRTISPHDTAALRQHVIGFAGEPAPVPEPPSSMAVDGTAVLDEADPANPLGDDVLTVDILDGRVLDVFSSRITGPDTAVIAYTRNAEAPLEAYSSLAVGGQNRTITGLDGGDGGGSHFHTLTFTPGDAQPNATGSVEIDGAAVVSPGSDGSDMLLGDGTIQRTLDDGQSPLVLAATAVSLDTIRVSFTEPVVAPGTGAGGWAISGRDAVGLAVASSQDLAGPSASLDLTLGGDLPDTAPDAITLSYRPAGGSVEDAAGNGLVASSTSVGDGIVPEIRSAAIAGPDSAEIRYTEPMWAEPGAYASVTLASGGAPRAVDGLEGNGTAVHTVAFGGDPAGPAATGVLEMDPAAVRDAAGHALGADGAIDLDDGQSPSVRSATAVSLDTMRVLFSEPVLAPGAGAGGWSVSGRDAEGLDVALSQDIAEPSTSLDLTLDGDLPDTAPDGVVISYDPAGGNVADPAGNEPAASSTSVGDGIAPGVRSARVAGPNAAEIQYTEPVWAAPGAYASVTLSSGGGLRVVSSLTGNGTAVHTVAFGGDPAGPGATGVLEMDETAVIDAARLPLGTDAALPLDLAGAAPPQGNATARAAFTARNAVTITYSAALGPPAGHDGPVYAAVEIDAEDGGGGGTRAVSGVEGLGTAVHTVAFGGDGVGRNQSGAITLAVDLEGTGGQGVDPPRFAAGDIPVASGRMLETVLVAQTRPAPVSIEPDGFTRAVDGTAAGEAARLAINVTALARTPDAQGTATFPAEAVTLTASFGAVTFPPGVTAMSVPAAGTLYLYVDGGEVSNEAATAALAYPSSGGMILRTIVEAGGNGDGRITFDIPVRISLDGQAGGRAFYIEGEDGAIVPIDLACAADDTERVHRQLGGSGECRIESGGDMVVHTYHLTRFGTAASERGTPPPVDHTCSMRLGSERLAAQARPGDYSDAAEQAVVNLGSLPFARVELDATPWSVTPLPGAPVLNATLSQIPANATLLSAAGSDAGFAPLPAGGASVARNLGGGLEAPLWFMLNLTGHAQVDEAELAQRVEYTAECAGAG